MSLHADLLLRGGRVLTVDAGNSIRSAVAVLGNRIVAVGSDSEVMPLAGPCTTVIDLRGRTLIPGFCDSHVHLGGTAGIEKLFSVAYPGVKTISEIRDRVQEVVRQARPGEWIQGHGWDDLKLAEKRHPTRWDIDAVSPDNPVILVSYSAHLWTLNSAALERVGIRKGTAAPPGGEIEVRDDGEPTGYITEATRNMVSLVLPPPVRSKKEYLVEQARELNRLGVTSAHEATGREPGLIDAFREMASEGQRILRVYFMMRRPMGLRNKGWVDKVLAAGFSTGFGDEWTRLGPVKVNIDGSSIGGGAANPERPDPEQYVYMTQDKLDEAVAEACRTGCQCNAHATGELGISMFVTALERAMAVSPRPFAPHRIEHCNFLSQDLVSRIVAAGILPVFNPGFLGTFGFRYALTYGKARALKMAQFGTFRDLGVPFAAASDTSPLRGDEPPLSPLAGMKQLMTRCTYEGQSLGSKETVDFWTALRAYTINGAMASGEAQIKGSLEPGKLADLAVIGGDLIDIDPADLPKLPVDLTVVDGKIVYTGGNDG